MYLLVTLTKSFKGKGSKAKLELVFSKISKKKYLFPFFLINYFFFLSFLIYNPSRVGKFEEITIE